MENMVGFEPTTYRIGSERCATEPPKLSENDEWLIYVA